MAGTRLLAGWIVVGMCLVSAGCGGGASDSVAVASGGPPPASTSAATTTATGSASFCDSARSQRAAEEQAPKTYTTGSPSEVKAFETQALALAAAVAASAPAAIKPFVQTIYAADQGFGMALKRAGYVYREVDPAAISELATPALINAGRRVLSYLHTACGLPTS